ncbi:TspO/MBR family protein [Friedmanniella luteola]|uniref:TspO/MBR family protein n=1 Tax=Friedmanniella luteola TaxID=546871 RepID=A0A1H1ZWU8_9ACTN|nr:tryptophan-rich sensory protein [Friedmanniella luteola]SDT38271.1 TspO/MBR family protein [Friedmanniella luteola]
MQSDRVRSTAVAVTAVAQAVVGLGSQLVVDADSSTGAISDANHSPVTPAGYAFAIWGLVYLACLALAVYQALPAQRQRAVHRRTGWWLVVAFTAATVWVPVFATRSLWLAQVVILVLLGALVAAVRRSVHSGPAADRLEQFAFRLPVTLYLGWVTLATVAGFGAALRSSGLRESGTGLTLVSLLLVLAATAFSVVVVGRFAALAAFVFTAGWALVAIVVASPSLAVKVAAVLALLVITAVLVIRTGRSPRKATLLLG